MNERVFNFSAGPAILPEEVLKSAAEEMMNYRGSGMSVMEMSHRSKDFKDIIEMAEADLRRLMAIPDNYRVLFLQGGAWTQFSMVPMNLMKRGVADYVITGSWAKKAYDEAKRYGDARAIASSKDRNFNYIPDLDYARISPDADYVHICENNTIYGTAYHDVPDTKGKVLVADMSSVILSKPIDVSRYGLIYAGAQKNVGPAGTTIVIIREDLITEDVHPATPTMLRYRTHADKNSLFNTPPTYGIYICGKVFQWLLGLGGLESIARRNKKKAALLYDYLDESELFYGTVERADRSLMNVTFKTDDDELNERFVEQAEAKGLVNLKGHRSVGGMRASIYNAMPVEGVEALVRFMREFEANERGRR
ncbi:MAG: 3-phosphoserine/phosphohydroxythreonine transaminase [Acholeplasmataceae bacterium]